MNQQFEKIKKHLSDNKVAYVSGGVCLGVGATGMWAIGNHQTIAAAVKINAWKSTVTVNQSTMLIRRGHPGNVIVCDQTGEMFASVRRAAEVLGLHRRDIFNQIHGLTANVKGFTFTDLGEAK